MGRVRWIVSEGDGAPLAAVLARAGIDVAAIDEGRVFIGRRRAKSRDERVRPGEAVEVADASPAPFDARVLARRGDLVAVDKPAGVPTIPDHAGATGSLLAATARAVGVAVERVHPTSRLDRDVSGVVVFALSRRAADLCARARAESTYHRRYVALASRAPMPREGTWDTPIGRASDPRLRAPNGRNATHAASRYASVAVVERATVLALAPITGRTHQLRVHASQAGAPLLGDRAYGGPPRVVLSSGEVLALKRIALHAARVTLAQEFTVSSPIPNELAELWLALGGSPSVWDMAVSCPLAMS